MPTQQKNYCRVTFNIFVRDDDPRIHMVTDTTHQTTKPGEQAYTFLRPLLPEHLQRKLDNNQA